MRLETHVGKEFSGVFIIMIFLLLTFSLVLPTPGTGDMFPRTLISAYSPTTIAGGSLPMRPPRPVADWIGGDPERPECIGALNWMRINLNSTDVVAAWWDYGYWITAIANKTTLADNGTTNSTQIAQIGLMFMSNETEAIKILDRFGATYVVVFTTFQSDGSDIGWGDEGKWRWMAKISGARYGFNDTDFIEKDPDTGEPQWGTWNDMGKNTVIYKLMTYGKETTLGNPPTVYLEHFEEAYFSQTAGAYVAYSGAIPLVCVYKINY